jgi:A nuclease family of the HNH/ENDO VII superfamily with conserved AHH
MVASNTQFAQGKDKQDDPNRINAETLDKKDASNTRAARELESRIDWQRYISDHSYKSLIDNQFDIPSGITHGTGEAGNTEVLRGEFARIGIQAPDGYEIHHIIPKNEPRAAEARDILERNGIGIDDMRNGAILPRGIDTPNPDATARHEFTFGQNYIEEITNRLRAAEENNDVRGELRRIAHDLLNP